MNNNIINVAVIAHVDHGKTTLVDALLKQSHVFRDNEIEMQQTQIMDNNDLERERGITILAKNCSIRFKDIKINIIDTPGHADFSGEVERTLGMADGVLLIVDAQEGPMPQTRFVLKKALELGLKTIVVVNKIDKKMARPSETVSKIESLFLEIAKENSQLDFPVLYAIGKKGAVFKELPDDLEKDGDVYPLIETIVDFIPAVPKKEGLFKMSVSSMEYDTHLGRMAIGKVHQGIIEHGMKVVITDDPEKTYTIDKLMIYEGLGKREVESAENGEIVCFSGIDNIKIGKTVSHPSDLTPLPQAEITKPTMHITMQPNTSPLSGREGKFFTSRQIEERLAKEVENNLSLRVNRSENGSFIVSGKGELHLSILLESMRREGFELQVGKPEAIQKVIDGVVCEPVEEVYITVPSEFVGIITEEMGKRYGNLIKMAPLNDEEVEFIYQMPTRVLIGLRNHLYTLTKGTVIYNTIFLGYEKLGRTIPRLRHGVLISSQSGSALSYGLNNAQGRGIIFIGPGEKVYEGMIVGSNSKEEDITVNVCRGKQLTNMRSKSSDGIIQLTPPTRFSLEQSLDFLSDDELLEITPKSLRLRKKLLTELERKRHKK